MSRTATHPTSRTLLAGAVLGTLLTVGGAAAGLAGATTPATSATPSAANCVKGEKVLVRLEARESKANTWLTKAGARETKAIAAGHPKIAARIAKRITRVKKLETKGTTRISKIEARCGSATS